MEELCLIDSGVRSLLDLALTPNLQVLNLHCNQIVQIENLYLLRNLRHLDLSSNQIRKIEGLESLSLLRTLNLACNHIRVVEGLGQLKSMVKLNLAYNQIEDVSGFQVIQDGSYKLSHIELHGNRIQDVHHVARSLGGCISLRHLSLASGGAANPVCHRQEYKSVMWATLPRLEVLDGLDRQDRLAPLDDILADIPGLDEYLDFLVSNGSSDTNPVVRATPRIDAVLEKFKDKSVTTPEVTTDSSYQATSNLDTSQAESNHSRQSTMKSGRRLSADHEVRLEKLEHQLTQLLYGSTRQSSSSDTPSMGGTRPKTPVKVIRHTAKRDIDATDESDQERPTRQQQQRGRTTRKSKIPSYQKHTQASRHRSSPSRSCEGSRSREGSRSPKRTRSREASPARIRSPQRDKMTGARLMSKTEAVIGQEATAVAKDDMAVSREAITGDLQMRDDLKSTYVQLMQELETERERRWKAEQATKKLADHIKELQTQAREGTQIQDIAVQATSKLKQSLTNERESRIRRENTIEGLEGELTELRSKLVGTEKLSAEHHSALKAAEQTILKREQEHTQQQAHEAKRIQEAQAKAAACTREVEILRNNTKTQKAQIQQLQELLANREQEHRKELSTCLRRDSPEIQDFVKKELGRVDKAHSDELRIQQQRIDSLSKEYSNLEDEFRMALQIESSRFKELQDAFERTSSEASQNKQALGVAQRKDERASQVINELTSMVKEQKGRISELSRAKHEQSTEYKERVQNLEDQLEEARRRMIQLEMLKQEKIKLLSTTQAQESVIEGLRQERKLWEQELAQQGTSLAQDRGRLEAKIETLTSENATLNKHLQREADAVKIKAKLIDDQTETIRKLKEAIVERDQEVKKAREDTIKGQRDLEEQLASETRANQDLQERLDRARERKEELKGQVEELQEELEQSKDAHGVLNNKWKEKSNLISELEDRVSHMKTQWEDKERKLTLERDKAIEAARLAIAKLKSMDDAFRQQLDNKEESNQRALEQLEDEKQSEIDAANKRVIEVEEEMRELLRETAISKRQMEDKFQKLTKAFSEIQDGIL